MNYSPIEKKIIKYWDNVLPKIIETAKSNKDSDHWSSSDKNGYINSFNALSSSDMRVFVSKNGQSKIRLSFLNNILLWSCYKFMDIEGEFGFRFFGILHSFSHLDTILSRSGAKKYDIKSHFIGDFLSLCSYSDDEKDLSLYLLDKQVSFLFARDFSISNLKKVKNKNRIARELILFVFCTLFVTKKYNCPEIKSKIISGLKERWQYLEITNLNFNLFNTYLLDSLDLLKNSLGTSYGDKMINKIKIALVENKFGCDFSDILFRKKDELEKMNDISKFIIKEVVSLLI